MLKTRCIRKGGTHLILGCLMGVVTEISFRRSSFSAELHFIGGGSSMDGVY